MEILLWLQGFSVVQLALMATLFTWFMTLLGAALVFFFKSMNIRLLNMMLGFASGVMIAASFFSLLLPAKDLCEEMNQTAWIILVSGFFVGALFIFIFDYIIRKIHAYINKNEEVDESFRRNLLLIFSITLHNIPEGLAVGVAFGMLTQGNDIGYLIGALSVAFGIGIQNFPEGAAVSIPLRKAGFSRWKSFLCGQASGMVEPIAGVLGAMAVIYLRPILPFILSLAAGAMIYVSVDELIPNSKSGSKNHTSLATLGCIVGFGLMMMLDVFF